MKNNKGYSLIEVVVTIGLLAVIGLILALNVKNLAVNQDDRAYERIVERIISASDIYIQTNEFLKNKIYVLNEEVEITLDDLINAGLIEESDKINPIDDSEITGPVIASEENGILNIELVED